MHAADGFTDQTRGVMHIRRGPDAEAIRRHILGNDLADGLRDRQIPGSHEHQHAVARIFEHAHFSEGADLIDAGIGTGVGQEHEAVIDAHSNAISHDFKMQK